MADPTADFFSELGKRQHEPMLARVTGTVRFDLAHDGTTDHYLVAVDNGDVTVAATAGTADAVIRTDRALFDEAVTGRANGMTAVLRGEIVIEGNVELLLRFLRLLPGPVPADGGRRPGITSRRSR